MHPALYEARQDLTRVARRLILFHGRRCALRTSPILVGIPRPQCRQSELGEQHVETSAEPPSDQRQERHQVGIGSALRPCGVDRVPVHREEVADLCGLSRSEPPILLQVLHVEPDGDERRVIGGPDGRGHLREPPSGLRAIGWNDAIRVLVAEVPRPQRLVARQRSCGLAGEERLGPSDGSVCVPVADPSGDHLAPGDHPESIVSLESAQGPSRDPVRTAHVTREQRGHDAKASSCGQIGDGHQASDHDLVHSVRLRLEVLPSKEQPNRVEATRSDPLEVVGDLGGVERGPPPHGRACWPVVDPQAERRLFAAGTRLHGPVEDRRRCSATTR